MHILLLNLLYIIIVMHRYIVECLIGFFNITVYFVYNMGLRSFCTNFHKPLPNYLRIRNLNESLKTVNKCSKISIIK